MYYIVFLSVLRVSQSTAVIHNSDICHRDKGRFALLSPYSSFQEDLSEQAFLQKEDFFFFPQKLIKKVFQGGEVLPVAC